MLCLRYLLFIGCVIQVQSNSIGWQSFSSLSGWSKRFSPKDEQALLLSDIITDSFEVCAQLCHGNIFCRIYDFDGQSNHCRLFEGDGTTMGSIISSSSLRSAVGMIELTSEEFFDRGLSCSSCEHSRYLTCLNSTYQCPLRTIFDGSICRSQNLIGDQCRNEIDCRVDLNLTCLPRKQCGPLSLQNGVTVGGYPNGTAGNTSNALNKPFGVAIGKDDSLFVSEYGNARVTRLSSDSLVGTIVAGGGVNGNASTQLNNPSHLYVDAASSIYVSDTNNGRIMLWSNGSAAGVPMTGTTPINSQVTGIAVDSQKNIYVTECGNHRVTKWTPNATSGIVVAGVGMLGNSSQHLAYPFGLYLDELHLHLYVADYSNNRIQRFTLGGSMNGTTVAGGNGLGSNDNQLYQPQGVCVSKKTGAIYIADTFNNRVTRWNPGAKSGVTIAGIAGTYGTGATLLYGPAGVALSQNETYLYVSDLNNNRIQRFQLI